MKPIRKAILPVAGLGTRFLPATKAMPKEMLPVVDRPLIQHVVDEARQAGIEHFIFVTGRNKGVIEDHFDRQFELEHTLTGRQRGADLEALARDLPGPGTASFTRQQLPLGLGHAVWCARELVGHEPFALLLPDVLVQHNRGCLGQMIDAAGNLGESAIALESTTCVDIHRTADKRTNAAARAAKLWLTKPERIWLMTPLTPSPSAREKGGARGSVPCYPRSCEAKVRSR
jgi:UTP--glucose-1-phosphate uridylyltransferase